MFIKKWVKRVLRGESGFAIGALIGILALIAAGYFSWPFITELMDPEETQFEQGEIEVRDYHTQGCWWLGGPDEYYGCRSQFNDDGNVFEARWSMQIDYTDFRAGRDCSGNTRYELQIWTWDDVEEEPDEYVGSSYSFGHDSLPWWDFGSGPLPEVYVYWPQGTTIIEGSVYCILWILLSGDSGCVWFAEAMTDLESGCSGEDCMGVVMGGIFKEDFCYEYTMVGFVVQTPEVVTVGSEIRNDSSVWLSGWCDVFGRMDTGFFVSEDEDTVIAGAGVKYPASEADMEQTRFYFRRRVVSILSDVTYYYRAYAELDGQFFYGAVKSFERLGSDILPALVCDVIVANVDVVEFQTSFIDVSVNTSWNISIYYGLTMTILEAKANTIAVENGVEDDGVWNSEVSASTFESGGRYYYKACAEEDLGTTVCSNTKTFINYDPSQPGTVNWVASIFGISFTFLWWGLALIVLLAVWYLSAKSRNSWIGVIGTGVVMIALITFGFVNAWVVVLLAIVVGWIIFKLVFKHSGGTGG